MKQQSFRRLKLACYSVNISMSVVGNLPPLLFLTFESMYGISYSRLGLLVLVNFFTQLTVDLIFSFFSHRFNIAKTVRFTPVLTVLGLLVYLSAPLLFPGNVYIGLLLGTVLFAASGGLCEVLISPVIAAIPTKDPDREMSKLHSVYAWGVVGVIIAGTVFLQIFGRENWQWLMLLMTLIPLLSAALFCGTEIPQMETPRKTAFALPLFKNRTLWLFVLAIFLGGAAECTMAQWASSYLELALGIDKVWGDLFGAALFALMLAAGRSLYAKIGKDIRRVLLFGSIGAVICYLVTAITSLPLLGLFTCAMTGLCVSMLWPGSLIVASDELPSGGVLLYALMAAGGDLGGSVGPQLIGMITDFALENDALQSMAATWNLLPEQFGMKLGMLFGALFPLLAIPVYLSIKRRKERTQ